MSINFSGLKITDNNNDSERQSTDGIGIQIASTSQLIKTVQSADRTEPEILCDDLDASQHSLSKTEGESSQADAIEPYKKTISHMHKLLTSTQAPMQKLLDMADNRDILSKELE